MSFLSKIRERLQAKQHEVKPLPQPVSEFQIETPVITKPEESLQVEQKQEVVKEQTEVKQESSQVVEDKTLKPTKRLKNGLDPYEMGKATQFKKGNPGGGRPKSKPITDAYARAVSDPEEADRLADALFVKACKGDVNAARELREGIEGKAMQPVNLGGDLNLISESERKEKLLEMLKSGAERVEKVQ